MLDHLSSTKNFSKSPRHQLSNNTSLNSPFKSPGVSFKVFESNKSTESPTNTPPITQKSKFKQDFDDSKASLSIDFKEDEVDNEPSGGSSINKIPTSSVTLKQMGSLQLRLNQDSRLDKSQLDSERSEVSHISLQHSPSQAEYSYAEGVNRPICSDLKPPPIHNDQKPRFSITSVSLTEEKESHYLDDRAFLSPTKSYKEGSTHISPITPKGRIDTNRFSLPNILVPEFNKTASVPNNLLYQVKSPITPASRSDEHLSQSYYETKKSSKFKVIENNSMIETKPKNTSNSAPKEGLKQYFINFNKLEVFDPKNWLKQVLNTNPRRKVKCSCDDDLPLDKSCSRALGWLHKRYRRKEHEYLKNTYERIVSDNGLAEASQMKQIQKDINRTYPECKLFAVDSDGAKVLERVLNAFAKYDPIVGYVQGMNFIAGSLLYHAEEYVAFWILVSIFETLEMRDIYLPKLPGLSKHCQIIDMLILNLLPEIHAKLVNCEFEIKSEIFCSEWIFALFGSVVPIEDMGTIYDNLLDKGWPFFYKLVLAFLINFKKQIEEETDITELLTILKSQNHLSRYSDPTKSPYFINWQTLCQRAEEINFDSNFIYEMHLRFDTNNQWFRTS